MQPRCDECTKCGLIFSKYRDPNYHSKREEQETGEDNEAVNRPDSGVAQIGELIQKHKLVILFLVVFPVLVVGSLLQKSNNDVAGSTSGPTFTVKSEASAKVTQLMKSADLDSAFDGIDEELQQFFNEQLPHLVKERGGTEQGTVFIQKMIPNAFREETGTVALANWLQITLQDDDLDTLIALYDSHVVRKATELSKDLVQDTPRHESFLSGYESNPPGPRRRQALEKLVDVMSLDQFMMMIWAEGHTSMITLAAASAPGFTTEESSRKTSQSIRDMREMLPFALGPMREEAIRSLAWQLESYELMELQALARALDTPESAKLFKEIRRGVESYLEDATAWLSALTAQKVGNI